MTTRWQGADAPRGDDYDARWRRMADAGANVHGEADLVERLLRGNGGMRVLDAGCGTGRVAVELATRGFEVVGVDADPRMLDTARGKAPDVTWLEADLADPPDSMGADFDLIVLAGNVMIFVAPGTEGAVLTALATRLRPGGLLVSGFSVRPDRLAVTSYDELCAQAGLQRLDRWATWDGDPFNGGDYAVNVHRRP
ncbi:class I SAM-dependent DNA methyltransferase [Mycobacterium sp. WMMD1722]|uniref:class I SAM-dependent DNA methyltransferase n=1 Tax=Mycobacterium sp. WMMD1722 TaxID=3404117 RepID=UPI003BF60395